MDTLKISDYLLLSVKFEDDPNPEIQEQINEFLSKIVVREYLPLKNKEIILMQILSAINKDYDAPGVAVMLEMSKIEKGLLAYCVNLENDLGVLSTLYHAYDMIHQYGLYDLILKQCGDDYKRLVKMVDDALNISNLYRITETAALFDADAYDSWIQTMSELQTTLNSDAIKGLLELTASNDPNSKELLSMLQQEAINEVNTEIQTDRDKFRNALKLMSKDTDVDQNDLEEGADNTNVQ